MPANVLPTVDQKLEAMETFRYNLETRQVQVGGEEPGKSVCLVQILGEKSSEGKIYIV